ncbi:MAG TPA: GntR family transcriptional regulator [Planctomycetota bacterium]|nr:GntR family transcriptional regulator [Planctomycetota bacterium]
MNTGRRDLAGQVADAIKGMLAAGGIASDSYLPPERDLATQNKVSRVTVRRALKRLVGEGLIEAIPSQGYRPVAARPKAASPGPVAYVLAQAEPSAPWDFTHEQILSAFNRALISGGRHALAIGCRGKSAGQTMQEVREAGCAGVVLDTSLVAFVDAAAACGLPCVIVDAYADVPGVDVVIQDNFNGARQAVGYLLGRERRRLAWLGSAPRTPHSRERFAGARAALADAGLDFAPELTAEFEHGNVEQAQAAAGRLLAAAERPDGIVCMWLEAALGAERAIRAGGAKCKGVELVAWATEREYREVLAPEFLGGTVPAAAVWRPEEMARVALERLEARRLNPAAPAVRVDIQVRLVEPAGAEQVLKNGNGLRNGRN